MPSGKLSSNRKKRMYMRKEETVHDMVFGIKFTHELMNVDNCALQSNIR